MNEQATPAEAPVEDAHAECSRRPCAYCRSIVIADQGPEDDDTYVSATEHALA